MLEKKKENNNNNNLNKTQMSHTCFSKLYMTF